MEPEAIFNVFYSIVTGRFRPHLFNESIDSAEKIEYPSFNGYIDFNAEVHIKAFDGLLIDEDLTYYSFNTDHNRIIPAQQIFKKVCSQWEALVKQMNLPEPKGEKSIFLFQLNKLSFCLTLHRIEKVYFDFSDRECKTKVSNDLIVDLLLITKELDFYSGAIKTNPSTISSDANIYAIDLTKQLLIELMSYVSKRFTEYCSYKERSVDDWKQFIEKGKTIKMEEYKDDWPIDLKAKSIIYNLKGRKISNKDYVILSRNKTLFRVFTTNEINTYIFNRTKGNSTLLEWLIHKDGAANIWGKLTTSLTEAEKNLISENEHQMYNELVDIVYSELFQKNFDKIPFEHKNRLAKTDFKSIEKLIDNTITNAELKTFSDAYDVQRTIELLDSIQKVLRGTVYETKGYAILHHAEAEALIRYRNFLSDFLNKEKSGVTIQSNSKPDIISNGKNKLPISYNYIGFNKNPGAIADLLDALKKCGFVAPDTNFKDFKKIFRCEKPDTPIMWYTHVSDLAYFIKYIHREIKVIENLDKTIWTVSSNLFVLCDGTHIDAEKLKGQKKPARAKELESAANHLK